MREPVAPVDAYVILGARCYAAENHWQFCRRDRSRASSAKRCGSWVQVRRQTTQSQRLPIASAHRQLRAVRPSRPVQEFLQRYIGLASKSVDLVPLPLYRYEGASAVKGCQELRRVRIAPSSLSAAFTSRLYMGNRYPDWGRFRTLRLSSPMRVLN